MKTEIKDGKITIDVQALVDSMSEQDVASFFEHLVFEEKLLQCFVDMMTSNYVFDSGFHSTTYSSNERIKTLAGTIREKLMPLMPDAHRTQLLELIEAADRSARRYAELLEEKFEFERKFWDLKTAIKSERAFSLDGQRYYGTQIEEKVKA